MRRRQFLLGSVSAAATLAMNQNAHAGVGSNTDAASKILGTPNLRHSSVDLEFLLKSQQNATPAPINIDDFQAYIDQNAIFQRLGQGESPELYSLLLWHALSLDLSAQDHATVAG